MSDNLRSSLKSEKSASNTKLRMLMISHGQRTPDATGDKMINILVSPLLMLISPIPMNSWVPRRDFVLLLSLIDVTSHCPKLLVCSLVELQLVRPELVKQKLSRILEELSVFSSLSSTAPMSINIEIWLRSSRVFANQDFGVASMSSTESHLLLSLSSLLKSSLSLKLKNLI
jgi:hypothetical protein